VSARLILFGAMPAAKTSSSMLPRAARTCGPIAASKAACVNGYGGATYIRRAQANVELLETHNFLRPYDPCCPQRSPMWLPIVRQTLDVGRQER